MDVYQTYTAKSYFSLHPDRYKKYTYKKAKNQDWLIFYRLMLFEGKESVQAYTTLESTFQMNLYFKKEALGIRTYLQRHDCSCSECWKKQLIRLADLKLNTNIFISPGNAQIIWEEQL